MKINILTIFPEIIKEYSNHSIIKKSLDKKLWNLEITNIRDYSTDKFNRVDDKPYGLEQGMLIKPDVLGNCIDNTCKNSKIIYMSPKGSLLNQEKIRELLNYNNLSIICGRYEGIDERVIEEYNIEEISIGDYVLTGGEIPAIVLIDSVSRYVEGVLKEDSIKEESFSNGLLEYPQYTRPEVFEGMKVPEILLSGHHENIEKWRKEKSLEITNKKRPELLENK